MRKVERVDFLLVAFERVPDALAGDIPYLCGVRCGVVSNPARPRVDGRSAPELTGPPRRLRGTCPGSLSVTAECAGTHVENLGGAIAPVASHIPSLLKRTQQTTLSWLNWYMRPTLSDWGTRGIVEREPVLAVLPVLSRHRGRIEVARKLFPGTDDG